ncbi:ABC transporter permease subunit [Candidatus Gracilibacteria bacterium]|nr:ABC transporter permease subunit [Candidatus Gracilibacteria bacterium]
MLILRGAIAAFDPDQIAVARTLGVSAWRAYPAVIVPALRPALISAASLSIATAFGAYGTAATLSRGYRTIPLEIGTAFTERFAPELAAGLSVLVCCLTTTLLWGLNTAGQVTPNPETNET